MGFRCDLEDCVASPGLLLSDVPRLQQREENLIFGRSLNARVFIRWTQDVMSTSLITIVNWNWLKTKDRSLYLLGCLAYKLNA